MPKFKIEPASGNGFNIVRDGEVIAHRCERDSAEKFASEAADDWAIKMRSLRAYGLDTGRAVEVALDAERGDRAASDTLNKALDYASDQATERCVAN